MLILSLEDVLKSQKTTEAEIEQCMVSKILKYAPDRKGDGRRKYL